MLTTCKVACLSSLIHIMQIKLHNLEGGVMRLEKGRGNGGDGMEKGRERDGGGGMERPH